PFRNMTGDSTNDYLTETLAEEVIDELVRMGGLHVPARTSTFVIGRKNITIGEIAKQLDVEYVVEGSLQRVGKELRVIAQLVRASDDLHLSSERYDRALTDSNLLTMQEELANSIATTLRVKMQRRVGSTARRHKNAEAHELYMRGRYAMQHKVRNWLNVAIES